MPEGPEVRITTENINKKFKGTTLKKIDILSGRYKKHGPPKGWDAFTKDLPMKIQKVENKGKFIYMVMDDGNGDKSIWITLGLTGELSDQKDEHNHIIFETSNGPFYMNDQRNFGTIIFSMNKKELEKKLATLGPDPEKTDISSTEFQKIIRKAKGDQIIAEVLTDQKRLAGIGNYLRAEILYDAKISPFRKIDKLSDSDIERIRKSMYKVLKGTYDYQKKHGLITNPFQVYRKKVTPKGEEVMTEKIGSQDRSVWYVPTVQK